MSVPNETTPLQAAKEQVKAVEEEGVRGYAKDQVKDVEEEGVHGYLGSFICCRTVAPISVPFLQQNRQQILHVAHVLCAFALLLSFLAYWGGFAWGNTLARLSWVTVHGPLGTAHAGVKWLCWDLPSPPEEGTFGDGQGAFGDGHGTYWRCETWVEFDCSKSPAGKEACELCKVQAHALTFSVFMAVGTFYSFYTKTGERLNGHDSNFTKFMACFSALIGGTNFLVAILSYWHSCVFSAGESDLRVHAGVGLICMSFAAVLKVLMGLVHLGLPVEHSDKKVDDV